MHPRSPAVWELVAGGQELYPGQTAMQVILGVSQHNQRPEPVPGCPPALQQLMERCWSADPAARPTAEEVVEELRQLFVSLRPPPPSARPAAPPADA